MANEHSGHRERMRQRFLDTRFDGFEDHQILEMLLYYVYPQRDTNELAHRLLSQFDNSLSQIFDAPVDVLVKAGITRNAATFLSMIPDVCRIYLDDRNDDKTRIIDFGHIGDFFKDKFIGRPDETVMLMLGDAKGKRIYSGVVAKGSINSSDFPIRKIVDLAIRYNACSAAIAHNHPSGVAIPSKADLDVTKYISNTLAIVGVQLVDHIIVADDDYVSIADSVFAEALITSN